MLTTTKILQFATCIGVTLNCAFSFGQLGGGDYTGARIREFTKTKDAGAGEFDLNVKAYFGVPMSVTADNTATISGTVNNKFYDEEEFGYKFTPINKNVNDQDLDDFDTLSVMSFGEDIWGDPYFTGHSIDLDESPNTEINCLGVAPYINELN